LTINAADAKVALLIIARGQSNMSFTPSFDWPVPRNLHVWNSGQKPGDLGTRFVAPSGKVIGTALAYSEARATAERDRDVYLVNVSYPDTAISHWIENTSEPDMYRWLKANVEAALAGIGHPVELVDLEWQGETDASQDSKTWTEDFATVRARLRRESWYPSDTLCIVMGLIHKDVFGAFNRYLQAAVGADPARTIYVDTGSLPDRMWWLVFGPHMTAEGYWAAGHLAYDTQVKRAHGTTGMEK
jgi:hypothetical protein